MNKKAEMLHYIRMVTSLLFQNICACIMDENVEMLHITFAFIFIMVTSLSSLATLQFNFIMVTNSSGLASYI